MKHDGSIRGVVFDLDGVIADTEHLWEESWTANARAYGSRWTPEDTKQAQGMSSSEWSKYLAARVGDGADPQEIRERCIAHFELDAREGKARAMPGGPELVIAAARRVPVALASSAPRRAIDACIQRFGLGGWFRVTVSSDEVARGKPFPDVYLAALRGLDLVPGDAFGIEDSSNGIRAAFAAGLNVVAIPNRRYPPDPDALALATYVADSVTEAGAYVLSHLPPEVPTK
jgi:HAD superfamily hydrolase (TIGR01509 family)